MTATTPSRYPYSVVRWPGKRWAVWDNTADDVAYLNGEAVIRPDRGSCIRISQHLTRQANNTPAPDIATPPHARPACRACHGTGYVLTWRGDVPGSAVRCLDCDGQPASAVSVSQPMRNAEDFDRELAHLVAGVRSGRGE